MNCLRAGSSRASWSCMSSNAAASRPSSSSESAADRVGEVARRHLAGGALEPLDARGERARHEVAGERGEHERDRRRRRASGGGSARRWPARRRARRRRPRRRGPLPRRQRLGGEHRRPTGAASPPAVLPAWSHRLRRERARRPAVDAAVVRSRDRDVAWVARRCRRCLGTVDRERSALDAAAARAATVARCDCSPSAERDAPAGLATRAARRRSQALELLGGQLLLQPRRDVQVDRPDRARTISAKMTASAVAQRPQGPRHRATPPRRGSGTRRRAP